MPRKITVISQDFDNCFSIMTEAGASGEFNGPNKRTWDYHTARGVVLEDIKTQTRVQFNDYLTAITSDAREVRVYVGSDRQSYELDVLNGTKNGNGSVFPALLELCRVRSTEAQPWVFEPLLLADPLVPGSTEPYLRERGMAFQRIVAQTPPHLTMTERPTLFMAPGGHRSASKRSLLLNQMWDAYRQNPDADELEFHFIDDRQDLINDILTRLNPADMPPNMVLKASKFDYIGILSTIISGKSDVEEEAPPLGLCGTISSTRPAPLKVLASDHTSSDMPVEEPAIAGLDASLMAHSMGVLSMQGSGGPGFFMGGGKAVAAATTDVLVVTPSVVAPQ